MVSRVYSFQQELGDIKSLSFLQELDGIKILSFLQDLGAVKRLSFLQVDDIKGFAATLVIVTIIFINFY